MPTCTKVTDVAASWDLTVLYLLWKLQMSGCSRLEAGMFWRKYCILGNSTIFNANGFYLLWVSSNCLLSIKVLIFQAKKNQSPWAKCPFCWFWASIVFYSLWKFKIVLLSLFWETLDSRFSVHDEVIHFKFWREPNNFLCAWLALWVFRKKIIIKKQFPTSTLSSKL